jgi:hypothetical protein
MARVDDERAAKAMGLSWLVMGISNALVDFGEFPIRDILHHLKSTQEVLAATRLILERMREEHASGTGPWV